MMDVLSFACVGMVFATFFFAVVTGILWMSWAQSVRLAAAEQGRALESIGFVPMGSVHHERYLRMGPPQVIVGFPRDASNHPVVEAQTELEMKGFPADFRLTHRKGVASWFGPAGTPTNDEAFDRAFRWQGDPSARLLALTAKVRAGWLALAEGVEELHWEDGALRLVLTGRLDIHEVASWIGRLERLADGMRFEDAERRLYEIGTEDPCTEIRHAALWGLSDERRIRQVFEGTNHISAALAALKLGEVAYLKSASDAVLNAVFQDFPANAADAVLRIGEESLVLRFLRFQAPRSGDGVLSVIAFLGRQGTAPAVSSLLELVNKGVFSSQATSAVEQIQSRLSGSPGMLSMAESVDLEGAVSESVEFGRVALAESKPLDESRSPESRLVDVVRRTRQTCR